MSQKNSADLEACFRNDFVRVLGYNVSKCIPIFNTLPLSDSQENFHMYYTRYKISILS